MSPMKACPEFLDDRSPEGVEVYQLTTDYERTSLVYPDCQAFLADSRSMIINSSDGPQICHLDEACSLEPLSDMADDIRGFRLAASGKHLVFKSGKSDEEQLRIHRLNLETGEVEEIFHAQGKIPDTDYPVRRIPVATVSHDASRLAGLVYLDYDKKAEGETGIVVLDTKTNDINVLSSQPFEHAHLRYFPGPEEPWAHSLLYQHNHDKVLDETGKRVPQYWHEGDKGVDLHVISDDGKSRAELPFGRDGVESCIGHQQWRYPHYEVTAIMYQNQDNSYGWGDSTRQHLLTGPPVPVDPDTEHKGRVGREEDRHLLSQNLENSRICHLGLDGSGLRFAFDTFPVWGGERAGMAIYIGEADDIRSPLDFYYILNAGVVFNTAVNHEHAHPRLSPDGRELFFNSDYFGSPQAYMVRNMPWS
ncbi:MAG: hypothetical protein ACLFWL_03155 [Candidatus Brocadiia bacterium]